MIVVGFLTTRDGELVGFDVSGHSCYRDIGNDIVCAAVSSALYMAANTITEIIKSDADVLISEGKMFFKIRQVSLSCRDVLLGLKLHMLALEEQYPENVQVNYVEV